MKNILPTLRAALRLAAFMAYALPLGALQVAVARPLFRDYDTLPRLLHRGIMKIMGVRASFNGAAAEGKGGQPVLYASNHLSYMDVVVLGSRLRGSFISKAEVNEWPVVGPLARAGGVIFTERRLGTLRRDQEKMIRALNSGRNVILFPEAQTSNGDQVLPFKAGMLCAAFNNVSRVKLETEIRVQPVSIRIMNSQGHEPGEDTSPRHRYAWWGGINILSHFWNLAKQPETHVRVTFHPPENPSDFPDRHAFLRAVQNRVLSACDAPV